MDSTPIKHAVERQTMPSIYAERARLPLNARAQSNFPQWMINYTVSGHCVWGSSRSQYTASPGTIIMTRPDTWMQWRVPRAGAKTIQSAAAPDWDTIYCVYYPRPHWRPWLDAIEFHEGMAKFTLTGDADAEVRDAMTHLERVYAAGGVVRGERALHALEAVLIAIHQEFKRDEFADARIRRALDIVQASFAEAITVETLAGDARLSLSHFSALFAKATGIPPGEYIEQIRLSRAAEMLGFSAEPIGDVAARTGFTEPNYFARRFRLRYGLSPTQFRKENQSGAKRNIV